MIEICSAIPHCLMKVRDIIALEENNPKRFHNGNAESGQLIDFGLAHLHRLNYLRRVRSVLIQHAIDRFLEDR